MAAISARSGDGNSVVYVGEAGTEATRSGGTRAWRNNNPGNIIAGNWALQHGAIGAAGGFAVFPDQETGMRAVADLLGTARYSSLSIADAISVYAPPHENDTATYIANLQKLTGLDVGWREN